MKKIFTLLMFSTLLSSFSAFGQTCPTRAEFFGNRLFLQFGGDEDLANFYYDGFSSGNPGTDNTDCASGASCNNLTQLQVTGSVISDAGVNEGTWNQTYAPATFKDQNGAGSLRFETSTLPGINSNGDNFQGTVVLTYTGGTLTCTYDAAGALPVDLLAFSAKKQDRDVVLYWATANEENNDYFTIEKSTDGRNFTTIGEVAGAGNSDNVIEYDFMDEKPAIGKNYYRLKQTDFDGAYEYFNIQTVDFKGAGNVSIYPNPVTDRLTVNTVDTENVTVQIFNLMGQLVQQSNQTSINLADIAKGTYFVKVTDSSTQAVLFEDKLIKQ